jgi:hypothetical protein
MRESKRGHPFTEISLAPGLLCGRSDNIPSMEGLSLTVKAEKFTATTPRDSRTKRRRDLTPRKPKWFLQPTILGTPCMAGFSSFLGTIAYVAYSSAEKPVTQSLGWTHLLNQFPDPPKPSLWATAVMPGFHGEGQPGLRSTKCLV